MTKRRVNLKRSRSSGPNLKFTVSSRGAERRSDPPRGAYRAGDCFARLAPARNIPELETLAEAVEDELLADAPLLAEFGPSLGRPTVDTLKGSRIANLKELRFSASGGVWPVAFAFDRRRAAVLLIAGDKRARNEAVLPGPDGRTEQLG